MSHSQSLCGATSGSPVIVLAVDADEADRKRLESLGILPGSELNVLANNGGPVLVAIGETRVAVEKVLALKVVVA